MPWQGAASAAVELIEASDPLLAGAEIAEERSHGCEATEAQPALSLRQYCAAAVCMQVRTASSAPVEIPKREPPTEDAARQSLLASLRVVCWFVVP